MITSTEPSEDFDIVVSVDDFTSIIVASTETPYSIAVKTIEKRGGIERIGEFLANGMNSVRIAEMLGIEAGHLIKWMRSREIKPLLAEAKMIAAEVYAAKADNILEDCPPDKNEIALAKATSDHYKWQAKMLDRSTYGDQTTLAVKQAPPDPAQLDNEIRRMLDEAGPSSPLLSTDGAG